MYLSIIITFILLLSIIVIGVQNSQPLDIAFFVWKFNISLTALVFYSSIIGGAIIAVITLPKLVTKALKVRSLNREINSFKKKIEGLERQGME